MFISLSLSLFLYLLLAPSPHATQAAAKGHEGTVEALHRLGGLVKTADLQGRSPLYHAVRGGFYLAAKVCFWGGRGSRVRLRVYGSWLGFVCLTGTLSSTCLLTIAMFTLVEVFEVRCFLTSARTPTWQTTQGSHRSNSVGRLFSGTTL